VPDTESQPIPLTQQLSGSALRAAHTRTRAPSIKRQIKEYLDKRLPELELPTKPFKGELDRFPTQGFRTDGINCEYLWINAEYFRSWFSNWREYVEIALRLLFDDGILILPSDFGCFPGASYAEHSLKWNPRAHKKTGFYKLKFAGD
jgi:hypothetical protein